MKRLPYLRQINEAKDTSSYKEAEKNVGRKLKIENTEGIFEVEIMDVANIHNTPDYLVKITKVIKSKYKPDPTLPDHKESKVGDEFVWSYNYVKPNDFISKANESDESQAFDYWYKSGSPLSLKVKMMPINNITEPILFKIKELADGVGKLTDKSVSDILTSDEKKYLNKWSK